LDLFEPDANDVLMEYDFYVPRQKMECKGVRVYVESTTD
jgi:hypothetical protein